MSQHNCAVVLLHTRTHNSLYSQYSCMYSRCSFAMLAISQWITTTMNDLFQPKPGAVCTHYAVHTSSIRSKIITRPQRCASASMPLSVYPYESRISFNYRMQIKLSYVGTQPPSPQICMQYEIELKTCAPTSQPILIRLMWLFGALLQRRKSRVRFASFRYDAWCMNYKCINIMFSPEMRIAFVAMAAV